jgi:hypothetical protein
MTPADPERRNPARRTGGVSFAEGVLPSLPDTRAEPNFTQMLVFSQLHL